MSSIEQRYIEMPVRLSKSKIWQLQQRFFETRGVEAWKSEVPYYISSNAFIAHRYAQMVLAYIEDWQSIHSSNREQPFYILELGCGTGKFSFYFLKAINQLLKESEKNIEFCYVMSDFAEKNIDFCESNPSFEQYKKSQQLDFASLNIERDSDFFLKIAQKKYSELALKTPLIVFANYTFDCVTNESLFLEEGKLYEFQLSLKKRYDQLDLDKINHLNDVLLQYQFAQIDLAQLEHPERVKEILRDYQAYFQDQTVHLPLPMSAAYFLDTVKKLTNENCFFIVGDKGIALRDKLPNLNINNLVTYDGCYSLMVNFHFLGEYIQPFGDYLPTQNDNDFKVNLYMMGQKFDHFVNTKNCFHQFFETLGADEYCSLYLENVNNSYRFSLRAVLAYLKASYYDPDAYASVSDRINELMKAASSAQQQEVLRILKLVSNNIYQLAMGDDIYNLLGIFYQTYGFQDEAIDMYQKSIALFCDKGTSHFNLAVLYEQLRSPDKALFHYEKAFHFDKKNTTAQRKVAQLGGQSKAHIWMPLVKTAGLVAFIAFALYIMSR